MFGFVAYVLDIFHFTDFQYYIAVFCLVVFLGNFLGGLITGIILAYAGPIRPRKLTQTIAFRWCLFSDLLLLVFSIYYHLALIRDIEASHVVFWIFAFFAAPILAFIGSQVTGLLFHDKIAENRREYRRRMNASRAQRGGSYSRRF